MTTIEGSGLFGSIIALLGAIFGFTRKMFKINTDKKKHDATLSTEVTLAKLQFKELKTQLVGAAEAQQAQNKKDMEDMFAILRKTLEGVEKDLKILKQDHLDSQTRMDAFKQLDEVLQEALRYSNSTALNDYMIYKSEKIKAFAHTLLFGHPTISTLNVQLLHSKMDLLKATLADKMGYFISSVFAEQMVQASSLMISRLESELSDLITDKMNGKPRRFSILIEKFLQENLSLTIREHQKYETRIRKALIDQTK